MKWKEVRRSNYVTKNTNNSMSIDPTLMKIYIQVVSDMLNKFVL